MSANTPTRCICDHAPHRHIFDGPDSICANEGCQCPGFYLWEVKFYDPYGVKHTITNVAQFVQTNKSLFLCEDVELRTYPRYERGELTTQNHYWSRAERGLESVMHHNTESWKGWTIAQFPKTYKPTKL